MGNAQINFTQGSSTGGPGVALLGVTGTAVIVSNGDDSGIVNYSFTVVDVGVGSEVTQGSVQSGSAPTYSFMPDVSGCYVLQLETQDNLGNVYQDVRVFGIPEVSGRLIPSYLATDGSMNFQTPTVNSKGWSPYLQAYLKKVDDIAPQVPPAVDVTKLPYNADPAGSTDSYAGIQAAINDMIAVGGTVVFPLGIYRSSTTLNVPTGFAVTMLGVGSANSTIFTDGTVSILDATTNAHLSLKMSGLTLGQNASLPLHNEGTFAVSFTGSNLLMTDVMVQGFETSIIIDGSNSNDQVSTLLNVECTLNPVVGLSLKNYAQVFCSGLQVSNSTSVGVKVDSGASVTLDGGFVTWSAGFGVHVLSPDSRAFGVHGFSVAQYRVVMAPTDIGCIVIDADPYGCDFTECQYGGMIVDNNGNNFPTMLSPDNPIASASTIAPAGLVFHVSGTTTIETITPSGTALNQSAPITLRIIFDGACAVGTSGNISRAATFAAGQLVTFVLDPTAVTPKWSF
jgi:hypothetical protein